MAAHRIRTPPKTPKRRKARTTRRAADVAYEWSAFQEAGITHDRDEAARYLGMTRDAFDLALRRAAARHTPDHQETTS